MFTINITDKAFTIDWTGDPYIDDEPVPERYSVLLEEGKNKVLKKFSTPDGEYEISLKKTKDK
jgi:hypothetical protein